MKMKSRIKLKNIVLVVSLGLSLSSPLSASIITFNPSASLDFQDVYYGKLGWYTTVQGSATGWGTFTLNQVFGEPVTLEIELILTIGPESLGGSNNEIWSFDLKGKPTGTYSFESKTTSANADVWLTEQNPTKPVLVSATMDYLIYGGAWEFNQVVLQKKTVIATLPEPVSIILLFVTGIAALAGRTYLKIRKPK